MSFLGEREHPGGCGWRVALAAYQHAGDGVEH
jgi:hypothetical protein